MEIEKSTDGRAEGPHTRSMGSPVAPLIVSALLGVLALGGAGCGAAARGSAERSPGERNSAGGGADGGGSGAPSGRTSGVRYLVRADAALTRLRVEACFDGAPPARIAPASRDALGAALEVRGSDGRAFPLGADGARLEGLAPGACVHYALDLERATWGRGAVRSGGDLLLAQTHFLWRPEPMPRGLDVRLRLELPEGLHASAPFLRPGVDEHVLRPSILRVIGNVAFVREPPLRFEEGGAEVEVAQLRGALRADREDVKRWIAEAVRCVSLVDGRFPRERLHVVVVPVGPGARPVAFGLVRRGGGPSVMLLAHANAAPEALLRDWTAVHELSHLAMPRMYEEDRWLSEGFATYYQEILRGRGGLLSEEEVWARFLDGFDRGRAVGTSRSLWRESATVHQTGAYRRIYWAGAAYFLAADVRLRQRGRSLDELVGAGRALWGRRGGAWEGREVLRAMDARLEAPTLLPLAERWGDARGFPDVEALLEELGVRRRGDGVVLDDAAPLAAVRRALLRAPLSAE